MRSTDVSADLTGHVHRVLVDDILSVGELNGAAFDQGETALYVRIAGGVGGSWCLCFQTHHDALVIVHSSGLRVVATAPNARPDVAWGVCASAVRHVAGDTFEVILSSKQGRGYLRYRVDGVGVERFDDLDTAPGTPTAPTVVPYTTVSTRPAGSQGILYLDANGQPVPWATHERVDLDTAYPPPAGSSPTGLTLRGTMRAGDWLCGINQNVDEVVCFHLSTRALRRAYVGYLPVNRPRIAVGATGAVVAVTDAAGAFIHEADWHVWQPAPAPPPRPRPDPATFPRLTDPTTLFFWCRAATPAVPEPPVPIAGNTVLGADTWARCDLAVIYNASDAVQIPEARKLAHLGYHLPDWPAVLRELPQQCAAARADGGRGVFAFFDWILDDAQLNAIRVIAEEHLGSALALRVSEPFNPTPFEDPDAYGARVRAEVRRIAARGLRSWLSGRCDQMLTGADLHPQLDAHDLETYTVRVLEVLRDEPGADGFGWFQRGRLGESNEVSDIIVDCADSVPPVVLRSDPITDPGGPMPPTPTPETLDEFRERVALAILPIVYPQSVTAALYDRDLAEARQAVREACDDFGHASRGARARRPDVWEAARYAILRRTQGNAVASPWARAQP